LGKEGMKRLAILVVTVSALLSVSMQASEVVNASDGPSAKIDDYVPGELLVKYKPSVRAVASEYFRSRWGVATVRSFKRTGVQHVRLPKDMTVEEALEIYRSDADVEYAEPNYYRYKTSSPNDTFFNNLWGLQNAGQTGGTPDADIDAPEAWDITTGSSNVVVAVLDSGVDYNHPDLTANIWANSDEQVGDANGDGFPGIQGVDDDGDGLTDEDSQDREPGDPGYTNDLADDDDENGYVDDIRGWDFVDDDNDPMDSDDHGTHVAGTIAAVGNNNIGITGVSWAAKIMPLRFLNASGIGTDANAIRAIEYANAKGVHVINNSWGGGGFNQSLKNAIDASSAVVVCAAGNDGANNDAAPFYPASYTSSNIIAVAATDQNDSRASFSNYGATSVDVAAPGTFILSARPDRQMVWDYDFETGTVGWTLQVPWDRTSSAPWSLTDSPIGDYANNINISAISPSINLLGEAGAKLSFNIAGESETGYDFLNVETATNIAGPWTGRDVLIDYTDYFDSNISGISGSYSQWVVAIVDLGSLDSQASAFVRFRLETDVNITQDGWYIDNLSVSVADTTYSNGASDYQYLQGTSMATPHVAGLAALVWGLDLGQTYAQVKQRILNGVEVKSGLKGTIMTGGRINAFNSVLNVPTSPTNLSATAVSSSKINLSWSDNSYGEDGFKIERKTGATGVYSQIAVTAANATSYSDTGLDELTTYYYRVSAYRGINTSDFSADTNATTSATTSSSGGGGGGGGPCFIGTAGLGLPLISNY